MKTAPSKSSRWGGAWGNRVGGSLESSLAQTREKSKQRRSMTHRAPSWHFSQWPTAIQEPPVAPGQRAAWRKAALRSASALRVRALPLQSC